MDSIQVPTHFRERRRVAALRAGSAVRSGGGVGDESRPREDVGRVLVGLGDVEDGLGVEDGLWLEVEVVNHEHSLARRSCPQLRVVLALMRLRWENMKLS